MPVQISITRSWSDHTRLLHASRTEQQQNDCITARAMGVAKRDALLIWLVAVMVVVLANPRIPVAAAPSPEVVPSTPEVGWFLLTKARIGGIVPRRSLQDCASQLETCKAVLQQKKIDCQPEPAAPGGLFGVLGAIIRLILDFLFLAFRNCASDLENCTRETDSIVCPTGTPFTQSPVRAPTISAPVVAPPPTSPIVTTFYAIGDVPYSASEATILAQQMAALPNDAAFLIHVGDIRKNNGKNCEAAELSAVATILSSCPVPVFLLVGDNEYTGKC